MEYADECFMVVLVPGKFNLVVELLIRLPQKRSYSLFSLLYSSWELHITCHQSSAKE